MFLMANSTILSHSSSVALGKSVLVCLSVCHHFGPDRNISTTTRWISMKIIADIHGPKRMNPNYFDDPPTFLLALSMGQIFNASSTLVNDLIPAKVRTTC